MNMNSCTEKNPVISLFKDLTLLRLRTCWIGIKILYDLNTIWTLISDYPNDGSIRLLFLIIPNTYNTAGSLIALGPSKCLSFFAPLSLRVFPVHI